MAANITSLPTIKDLGDLRGKRVLVRADFNVPLDGTTITDDGRIRAALPTIKELVDDGAKVIIMAHLGRPKGEVVADLSLAPVAQRLGELLNKNVVMAPATYGPEVEKQVEDLQDGDVIVLENVRFNPEETSKDDETRLEYAKKIARLADVFVSDGFGVVHRKQGSVYDIAQLLPHAAGELILKEMKALSHVLDDPARPYTVVLGGSKVSGKLDVIANLLNKADRILIGGGMAYTFLKAQGHEIGTSLLEPDMIDTVRGYMETAKKNGVELILPLDVVVADKFAADAEMETVSSDKIPADKMGMDIGPKTRELFASKILDSRTVFWNGPMGVFEFPRFAVGTKAIATALEEATKKGVFTVVGGGDSASAVRHLGFAEDSFSHISTGGGASLELLEGKDLPGIAILRQ